MRRSTTRSIRSSSTASDLTSYAGKPLGDPSFAPVFDEINRRKAGACSCIRRCRAAAWHPQCRSAGDRLLVRHDADDPSLAYSGTFGRCLDIKFIFSHGGGTLPIIAQRIAGQLRNFKPEEVKRLMPNGFYGELKRQYYDIASIAENPAGMAAVFKLFPVGQLFYGSDAPFGSTTRIAEALN